MGESSSDRGAVVITGTSTGIGRAAALHLAGKGLRVFAGVRTASDGEAVASALSSEAKAAGGSVQPLIIDVADGESIARATAEVGERLGGSPLRGLVNNAGIVVGGPQEYLTLEDWRRQFEVNVFGLRRHDAKAPAAPRAQPRPRGQCQLHGRPWWWACPCP